MCCPVLFDKFLISSVSSNVLDSFSYLFKDTPPILFAIFTKETVLVAFYFLFAGRRNFFQNKIKS